MDRILWSRMDKTAAKIGDLLSFEEKYANLAGNGVGIVLTIVSFTELISAGFAGNSPYWLSLLGGTYLLYFSHNDAGRDLIGEKTSDYLKNTVKPGVEEAGSSMLTLASSIEQLVPVPGYRTVKWVDRVFRLSIIGVMGVTSYSIFPLVATAVSSAAPAIPANLLLAHSITLSAVPLTLGLMMLYTFDRLTMRWRWRNFKLGAVMLLATLQFFAVFQILFYSIGLI